MICYVSECWHAHVWVNTNKFFFALNVFIWNFVHVFLKPSNILLACDRQYIRHLCAEEQNIYYKYTVSLCFPWEAQTLLFLAGFFLVLWVLFPLEHVLLFYLIVNKVDLWRGLFFKWEILWYVICDSFTVINLCL